MLSVIIPSWGRYPAFLPESLDGILSASTELEVIVVATGETAKQCTSDARVHWITTSQRTTVGVARNIGLAVARGERVCFADADDIILPGTLELMVETMTAQPDLVSCACAMDTWNPATGVRRPLWRPGPEQCRPGEPHEQFAVRQLGEDMLPMQGASVHRLSVVRDCGGYPDANHSEDWALGAKLAWRGRIAYLPDHVGLLVREHYPSLSRRGHSAADLRRAYRMVRRSVWSDREVPPLPFSTWREITTLHRRRAADVAASLEDTMRAQQERPSDDPPLTKESA
jgi:glycosyltransferase involved in cell wall biosynthesis